MVGNCRGAVVAEKTHIMLGLVELASRGRAPARGQLASELSPALGLVSAHPKSCISRGLEAGVGIAGVADPSPAAKTLAGLIVLPSLELAEAAPKMRGVRSAAQ
jgi:hypothetical protein